MPIFFSRSRVTGYASIAFPLSTKISHDSKQYLSRNLFSITVEPLGSDYKEKTEIKSCFGMIAMTYKNSAALDEVVFDQPKFLLSKLNRAAHATLSHKLFG